MADMFPERVAIFQRLRGLDEIAKVACCRTTNACPAAVLPSMIWICVRRNEVITRTSTRRRIEIRSSTGTFGAFRDVTSFHLHIYGGDFWTIRFLSLISSYICLSFPPNNSRRSS